MKLPDGSCAGVIGDVVGHDMRAAAAMSQTRGMLRALSFDAGTPPSASLEQLDRIMEVTGGALLTTACVVRIDPGQRGWTLHWSSAGHPPPLVLWPDGTARYLDAEPGVPLGVDTTLPRPGHHVALPANSSVILYTDGLVERSDASLDRGLDSLADTAVLALRTPATPGNVPSADRG